MNPPALDPARVRELLSRFSSVEILIAGDVMLDRFVVGDVVRLSPEAPVPVVRFRSEYARLGGAANVAANVASLGARVQLMGVLGDDRAAADTRQLLDTVRIATSGLITDPTRPTVEKRRVVTRRNQQVARIDYETDDEVGEGVERRLIEAIERGAPRADVLVVSDYVKGAITTGVMACLRGFKASERPLLVDPKISHLDRYAGATVITPNQQEAESAAHRAIRTDEDARDVSGAFGAMSGCDSVLMTRGEHGMWLSSAAVELSIPSVSREVADVTGAGDTVVATVALSLAAGASLIEAAVLANHAAGIVVGKFGPATVSQQELLAQVVSA